jgi:glutathione S-transferase
MNDLILHHYPTSPFSEKVRLVLGYKSLAWKSVVIPAVSPKPDVLALTGGYRKTPFLQIGSDVYCDSALICDVLEDLAPTPTLYPAPQQGLNRVLAQWADTTLFWAAMAYNLQPKGAAALFEGAPPEVLKAFGADRAAMGAGMTRLRPGDAAVAYQTYLQRLASMLDGQDFLLGSAPCLADFSAYHPLWFTATRVPVMADILQSTPVLLAWMDRVAAIGHGRMEKYSAIDAIAACAGFTRASGPDLGFCQNGAEFVDAHGIALGSRVTVAAESFGTEATEGVLIAATPSRYTLQRSDHRAGQVQVHFPRIGYVLRHADV